MSQIYSPSASMIDRANQYLAAPEGHENIAKKGGRVFTRAIADAALAPLAAIETVVFAILTAVVSVLALTNTTKPVFDFAKNHTRMAADGLKNAFAGIAGRIEAAKKEEIQQTIETPSSSTAETVAIGGLAIAALAGIGYYFGVHTKAIELAKQNFESLSNNEYVVAVKEKLHSATDKVGSYIPQSIKGVFSPNSTENVATKVADVGANVGADVGANVGADVGANVGADVGTA